MSLIKSKENASDASDRDPMAVVLMRFITHSDVALSRASDRKPTAQLNDNDS